MVHIIVVTLEVFRVVIKLFPRLFVLILGVIFGLVEVAQNAFQTVILAYRDLQMTTQSNQMTLVYTNIF
jgi:hypothetical protein